MFTTSSGEENFLTLIGAKWKYTNDLSFDDLPPNWQQTNLGRSKAKMEDAILEYAERTKAGSSPPAPILRKLGDKYEVLDGVQRLCAEELLEATRFSGYVVTTDSEIMARKIRVLANHILSGGHAPDAAWTRLQAIDVLIIQGQMSPAEVARLGGWKLSDITEDKTFLDWQFAIKCIGGPDSLTKGVILNVAKHAKMDDIRKAPKPCAEFFTDLKAGKFSNGDSQPHIAKFFNEADRPKKKPLHEVFSERLENFREDPETQLRMSGRPTHRQPDDTKLRAKLLAAKTVTEDLIRRKAEILYVEEFYHIVNQIRKNLETLAKQKQHA